MRKRALLGVLPAVLLFTACGEEGGSDPARSDAPPENPPPVDQEYRASGTVLQSPDRGPVLCAGVAESFPPQCGGGVELARWDWDAVEAESEQGTTWGDFELTGTWDGETFTVTGTGPPSRPAEWPAAPAPDEPGGGDRAARDPDELADIQRDLTEDFPDDVLSSFPDEEQGVVQADVVLATPELQETVDERFGEGAVVLNSWLMPVSG
ncbi:hypothetical protein [Streptomyces sp. PT12]|uniref:hypothetical protein n=1 Tax=Streptomyces sp. PT12 TaxID=1510197 RepID=UPI0011BF1EA4|nr:hypothetical protein [Streptomyces sp. PT12]